MYSNSVLAPFILGILKMIDFWGLSMLANDIMQKAMVEALEDVEREEVKKKKKKKSAPAQSYPSSWLSSPSMISKEQPVLPGALAILPLSLSCFSKILLNSVCQPP